MAKDVCCMERVLAQTCVHSMSRPNELCKFSPCVGSKSPCPREYVSSPICRLINWVTLRSGVIYAGSSMQALGPVLWIYEPLQKDNGMLVKTHFVINLPELLVESYQPYWTAMVYLSVNDPKTATVQSARNGQNRKIKLTSCRRSKLYFIN